ncbi:MAG: hypothetical protein Q7J68_03875 [Thermoplasmata archaeon]|nr:hypothetical protein [Thermoplasmata archaeon]
MANIIAREWLDEVNKHPEKFGVTREHINAVDRRIKQLEEEANKIPRGRKRKKLDGEGSD